MQNKVNINYKNVFYLKTILLIINSLATIYLVYCFFNINAQSYHSNPNLESMQETKDYFEQEESRSYLIVDLGGAVKQPGVYKLPTKSRLADLISFAGGFDDNQIDAYYIQKNINLAEMITDERKYYIPFKDEYQEIKEEKSSLKKNSMGENNDLISINKAHLSQLVTLPGIGDVRGQAIIDNRPYAKLEDLTVNSILTEKIFNNIKELISL